MHGDFGVHMLSHQRSGLGTDRTVAKGGAFRAAGYDPDVFGHFLEEDPKSVFRLGQWRKRNFPDEGLADLFAQALEEFDGVIALGPVDEKARKGTSGIGQGLQHDVEIAVRERGDFVTGVFQVYPDSNRLRRLRMIHGMVTII